jgi:hypothetical protein
MIKLKFFSPILVELGLLLFSSAFCLAQNNNTGLDKKPKYELAFGYGITSPSTGLLGDLTNLTPGFDFKMNVMLYTNNRADIAFRLTLGFHSWYDSRHIRGTTDHRAKVSSQSSTLGLMYFLDRSHAEPDLIPYFCVAVGGTDWKIDSSTYHPLNRNYYSSV